MKKMFTLLALTLIVSMATFAQKPLYGTAATPQKAEKSLKVTMPNAKRVASKPMMAVTSKNGTARTARPSRQVKLSLQPRLQRL